MTDEQIRADARRAVAEDIASGSIPPEPSPEAVARLNRILAAPQPAKRRCDFPGCNEPAATYVQAEGANTPPKEWFACDRHRAVVTT